ncbi:hypothetical protein CB1_000318009 [Camelus ferus]|nr:hypothetical protein CB1_000318009 [Camelus ferus]
MGPRLPEKIVSSPTSQENNIVFLLSFRHTSLVSRSSQAPRAALEGEVGSSVQWLQTVFSSVVYAACYLLQMGMHCAFGKPQGIVARVHFGQVIMSICTKLQNKEHVLEALYRAKFKFPGHQKTHILKKWEFTKFNADEFENMMAEK